MKSKMKLSGQLRSYLRWPLILSILMLVMNIGMYFVDVMAGMWFTLFFAVYVIAAAVLYYRQRPQVINELITFATEYGQVQKHLIQELALPYAVMDSQGKLLWVNKEFTKITGKDTQYHKCIATIFPELTVERLPKNEEETDINVAYGEKNFRAHVKSVCIDELIQNSEMINTDIKGYFIQALYLFDETELREYMRKFEDETMVTGLLYLDNYDEALESVEEVRRSLLTALVERKINKYFNDLDGLVKRYENDKYIVVMRRSSLNELKEKKFDILEDVKTINIGNEMAVTISMGCWIVCEKLRVCENRDRPGSWPGRRSGRFKGRFEDSVFRRKNAGCGKEYESQSPRQGARAERIYEHEREGRCHGTPPAGCRFVRCGHRYLPCGENAE